MSLHPEAIVNRCQAVCLALLSFLLLVGGHGTIASAKDPSLWAPAQLELFDANVQYTSDILFPLSSHGVHAVGPLTSRAWTAAARPIARVAADGVSLIVVRVSLPAGPAGSVRVSLVSEHADAEPGTVWTVDDPRLVDASVAGGAIDSVEGPRDHTIVVPTVAVGARRFAFVLYRAPRNFDATTGSTAQLTSRGVSITVETGSSTLAGELTVVRPLVVFIHGTGADNDAWLRFPLWKDSANEVHGFAHGTLPFHATRISFNWIWNATGSAHDNAVTILPQLITALRDWREATGTAATQADVVTHSFGGFVARQVVQTQADQNPLAREISRNFRAAGNWGHGSIHKLITLAATHRGAASANTTAYLNRHGSVPGLGRETACANGVYIDKGALGDQMVLSDALRKLGETRVPGHAIAGSGRAALDPTLTFQGALLALFVADTLGGPYQTAAGFNNSACPNDALANYMFNLDPNDPPLSGSGATCSVTPNYDLVVSVDSALGRIPVGASTSAADLGLVSVLNHSAIHDPAFASVPTVTKVSDRIVSLLQQETTSDSFGYFPAVSAAPPTALEKRFSDDFSPSWLDFGTRCPAPSYDKTCPTYACLQVVPAQLRLEDSIPTPLSVYGLLAGDCHSGGEWVLAYSPTSSAATSRNCPVTLTSLDQRVVTVATNDVTGAQTVVAVGAGSTSIDVSVNGVSRLVVPVTVTGIGN
jgi:hypothetical protein